MARIAALDGFRGVLALVVVASHICLAWGFNPLEEPARYAVLAFFTMSGFVLARSYDGQPGVFVIKRIVRLWPLYASSIVVGHLLHGSLPNLLELFWWPGFMNAPPPADPPAWTLYIEVWATPVLLVLFWVAARSRAVCSFLPLAFLSLIVSLPRLSVLAYFALGVTAAQYRISFPKRVPAFVVWLGDISYSLYLTHWLVMKSCERLVGPWGAVISLPFVFIVAWCAWRWIERPSIAWSRMIGRKNSFATIRDAIAYRLPHAPDPVARRQDMLHRSKDLAL